MEKMANFSAQNKLNNCCRLLLMAVEEFDYLSVCESNLINILQGDRKIILIRKQSFCFAGKQAFKQGFATTFFYQLFHLLDQ